MIAKITRGVSIYGAISYNQKKIEQGQARVINTNRMIVPREENTHELFNKTLQSFESYLQANKRTKKPVIHISLNPSLEDLIDDAKLIAISDDYMEKLGYGNQPYIVYEHSDIDRKHLHIVSVNVDSNGVKLNDKYQKLRSMDICRDIEVKYGLKHINNDRQEESHLFMKKIDYSQGNIKGQISNVVKYLKDEYHFQSLGEYNALLSVFNINAKHIRGESEGNLFNGIIYNATTNQGDLIGSPIKSSSIGKSVGYDALNREMKKTSDKIKKKKLNLKQSIGIITNAKRNSKMRDQFLSLLKLNNIDVVFRENETGRIYGVTFIDHNNRMVYNGSRLGKEFSANMLNQWFIENVPHTEIKDQFIESELHAETEHLLYDPISVDEIFGSFYFNNRNENSENIVKKRKKGRKRKI